MSVSCAWSAVDKIVNALTPSLAGVRWVSEVDVEDEEGNVAVECTGMFDVVGEQYRQDAVEAAIQAIAEENAFLPARFWLVPDDGNQYDSRADAALAISGSSGISVAG